LVVILREGGGSTFAGQETRGWYAFAYHDDYNLNPSNETPDVRP
jgi:hypothetical protein